MAVCKIGEVTLNDQLSCPGLLLPGYNYKSVAYAFGGKNIVKTQVLHDLTLTASLTNGVWSGWYTIAQVYALLDQDGGAQSFEHPLAALRGLSGITVFVDKNSVAALEPIHPDATPSAPEIDGHYLGGTDPFLYSGTINLQRLT